jgi:hypothetical protein
MVQDFQDDSEELEVPIPDSRAIVVGGDSKSQGFERMLEELRHDAIDFHEPSWVAVVGGEDFKEEIGQAIGGKWKVPEQFIISPPSFEKEGETKFPVLLSKFQADKIADVINGKEKPLVNGEAIDVSYRKIRHLIVYDTEVKFVWYLLAKCPDLRIWIIRDFEDAGLTAFPKETRKLFFETLKPLSEYENETVEFLWRNVLVNGAVNMFLGLPDSGKTMVTCLVVTCLTRGISFPFSKKEVEPRNVLIFCKEDSFTAMWKPRLLAAGADLERVFPAPPLKLEGQEVDWSLDNDAHIEQFEKLLKANSEIGLLVIDPLQSFVGSKDLMKANDARFIMDRVTGVASRLGICALLNHHTTKAPVDSAIKLAAYSLQIMAAARMSWFFAVNQEKKNERLMLCARNKVGKQRSFSFTIESKPWPQGFEPDPEDLMPGDDDGVGVARLVDILKITADEYLQKNAEQGESANARIKRWLFEYLKTPVKAKVFTEEYERQGFEQSAVSKAAKQVGAVLVNGVWKMKASVLSEPPAQAGELFEKEKENDGF